MDNTYHRSFLVHELVHYLQYANGQDAQVECRQQLEPLAYKVQKRYLRDHQYWAPFSKNKILSCPSAVVKACSGLGGSVSCVSGLCFRPLFERHAFDEIA